jgi:Na+/H+-dicarboxylate symporter
MEKSLKNTKKPMGLSTKIFIALIAGAISGVLIHYFMPAGYIRDSVIVEGVLYVIGQGFIRLMQMLVVPLVFCSLICGSMAIGDTKTLGKVGIKTILFYLLTTAVAVSVALSVAMLINPGIGVTIENVSTSSVTITEKQPLTATPCIIDVPSILTVAPSGIVKDDIFLLTPSFLSSVLIESGIVAFDVAVVNAKFITGKNFFRNLNGLSLVKRNKSNWYTTKHWIASASITQPIYLSIGTNASKPILANVLAIRQNTPIGAAFITAIVISIIRSLN